MNIYDLTLEQAVSHLMKNGLMAKLENNRISLFFNDSANLIRAQDVIDRAYFNMPDLKPVQFHYMLAKSGLEDAISPLLDVLKNEDIEKYATYKAYLTAARFYDFSKSYHLFNNVKAQIVAVNPALDFDLLTLKTMWLDATLI